jgi:predicted MPP superfamily phosphohydrolase
MSPPVVNRRSALRLILGGGAAALGGYSVALEPAWLEVTEHDVPVPGLPQALAGYRVAQLTDIHLSSLGRVHDRIFEALRTRSVQLVVITGDAVDRESALPVLTDLCHAIAASGSAMLATIGNWEHWGGVPRTALRAAYARGRVRLLGDESMRLDTGVAVIATDDFCSGNADVATALHAVPRADLRIFLSHAPGIFDTLPEGAPSFHLGIAGHTHGGQIGALGTAVWVPPGSGRFRAGMYATAHGPLYVSRGVGTSVVPARLTCRPELPIFRFVQG